jgi:TonB family protein
VRNLLETHYNNLGDYMKVVLIEVVSLTIALTSAALGQSQNNNSQKSERVYSPKEVDRRAKVTHREEAKYTEKARRNCVNGQVLLKAVFTSSGRVENIEVLEGLPEGLNDSAIEAARKIKFKPAMKDGHPVSVYMTIEFNFDFSKIEPCKNGRRDP